MRGKTGKDEMPREFAPIIARIGAGEIGQLTFCGYRVKNAFIISREAYDFSMVKKWDYLADVLPEYLED